MTTKAGFEIKFVFLAYVPPFDKEEQSVVLKTETLKSISKTTDYLFKVFDTSFDESKVEIIFDSDGKQNNNVRSLILSLAQKEKNSDKKKSADKLAKALYEITDERNGTGLFAAIVGKKDHLTRVVLSRFKGDDGLINKGKNLLVDYVSEVFTKKSNHYKLAVFQDVVSSKSFWTGYSVDKQLSANNQKSISLFWVERFLTAKTAITPAQGTLHFSKVIKNVLAVTADLGEQEELISGVVNLKSKGGMRISVSQFCDQYLSPTLAEKVKEQVGNETFFDSVFAIDDDVYKKELGKTVLSLQDGIIAYVPTFRYEAHVKETSNKDGTKSVVIEGRLNSKKINTQPKPVVSNGRPKRNNRK